MLSNFNKVGLTLVLPLLTALSLNLSATEQQIDVPTKEGYFYYPPHGLKVWGQLTPEEQKKAEELKFDRQAFSNWLLKSNPTPKKWAASISE